MKYNFKYKFIRIAPRKIRLVTNLVKNMPLDEALIQSKFIQKSSAKPVYEILKSAVASCKIQNIDIKELKISSFTCDSGPVLKRRRFKSRGRAVPIKKRTSHINLTLITEDKKPNINKANKIKETNGSKSKS